MGEISFGKSSITRLSFDPRCYAMDVLKGSALLDEFILNPSHPENRVVSIGPHPMGFGSPVCDLLCRLLVASFCPTPVHHPCHDSEHKRGPVGPQLARLSDRFSTSLVTV
jgi:hypothetical protein